MKGGIIQLLEETDRSKTFRGGICRGDPEILSPIKRDFRRIQRRGADNKLPPNNNIEAVSLNSFI